jgi:hypothetical protein
MKQPYNIPVRFRGEEGYQLAEQYVYSWTMPDKIQRTITIPAGFTYDGASVPRLVWTMSGITPDGLIRAAALVHDFIYRHSGRLPRSSYGCIKNGAWMDLSDSHWQRVDADRLFARIMREAGVSKTKRRLAYLGVRAGGWASWQGEARPVEKMILNK